MVNSYYLYKIFYFVCSDLPEIYYNKLRVYYRDNESAKRATRVKLALTMNAE